MEVIDNINIRKFIQENYSPYTNNSSFLKSSSEKTKLLWEKVLKLFEQERNQKGIIGFDKRNSFADTFKAGYVDKDLEEIVGLQAEHPLERAFLPIGGIKQAIAAAESYDFEIDPMINEIYSKYRKTHNQGVFDAYTPNMRKARHVHIITGLPDNYARGRIIGDYRRVALYGVDFLMKQKVSDWNKLDGEMSEEKIRLREELTEQYNAFIRMKKMALEYGFDISKPANTAKEAIQWTYFAYLAAIKEQNGAAMSVGRVSAFFDIFIEKDIKKGLLTEEEAQELIDNLVIKLRMVRFLRAPSYNELFSGDPIWATIVLGGMGEDGRTLVTKTCFRFLQTLKNLGPSPEPNLTILWSEKLPPYFKSFCVECSIEMSSIQYENDDLMRPLRGDDYAIACCVSAMKIGKEMQFFGARANLPKTLLYAINNGYDEIIPIDPKTSKFNKIGPDLKQYEITDKPLEYKKVKERFLKYLSWLVELYVNTLNIIHYMHDKYYYESLQMALYDTNVHRFFATGIAGFSILVDSLSAIKYANVYPIWKKVEGTEDYIATDFKIIGDFPKFGNNDEKVDKIGKWVLKMYEKELKKHKTYRNSEATVSILTITSNIVYGKNTGNTPDGRKYKEPFAPGANPMNHRDDKGAIASLCSVAKLPYSLAQDGISNTFTIIPQTLGKSLEEQKENLINLLDAYFSKKAQHLNVNVLNKETLLDAQENPSKYPSLTIRVSGYAVNFIKLTKEQQDDVINRTFHSSI